MPPRIRITEEAILQAALRLTREKGAAGVNARAVAKALGCSVQPVFRCFGSMEALRSALYHRAERLFDARLEQGARENAVPFLGMGLAYIAFAQEEPRRFRLLFLSGQVGGQNLAALTGTKENRAMVRAAAQTAGLDEARGERLFRHLWLTAHGIAVLTAAGGCDFSETQAAQLLNETLTGMKNELRRQEKTPSCV